jgi:hypothetical protein
MKKSRWQSQGRGRGHYIEPKTGSPTLHGGTGAVRVLVQKHRSIQSRHLGRRPLSTVPRSVPLSALPLSGQPGQRP